MRPPLRLLLIGTISVGLSACGPNQRSILSRKRVTIMAITTMMAKKQAATVAMTITTTTAKKLKRALRRRQGT
jgi:hypothetical protein